jgi:hypothetical protein
MTEQELEQATAPSANVLDTAPTPIAAPKNGRERRQAKRMSKAGAQDAPVLTQGVRTVAPGVTIDPAAGTLTLPDCKVIVTKIAQGTTAVANKIAEIRVEFTKGTFAGLTCEGWGAWINAATKNQGRRVGITAPARSWQGAGGRKMNFTILYATDKLRAKAAAEAGDVNARDYDHGAEDRLNGYILDTVVESFGGRDALSRFMDAWQRNAAAGTVATVGQHAPAPRVRRDSIEL